MKTETPDPSIYSKNKLISKEINKKDMTFTIDLSTLKKIKLKNRLYGHILIKTKESTKNTHIYLSLSSVR